MCALLALCGVLGVLQYHWIGEVTVAARDRLRGTLQASLLRTSQDFNNELVAACGAILPAGSFDDSQDLERQVAAQYLDWKKNAPRDPMFRHIGLALSTPHAVQLKVLDLDSGVFQAADWPADWSAVAKRTEAARVWLEEDRRLRPATWKRRQATKPPSSISPSSPRVRDRPRPPHYSDDRNWPG